MATWRADSYRLYQYAGNGSNTKAVIRLEEKGGPHALHAYFRDSDTLPNNHVSGNFYFLYYSYDQFQPMMDMLRNEKPIYVHAFNALTVYIGTHREPVGEGE